MTKLFSYNILGSGNIKKLLFTRDMDICDGHQLLKIFMRLGIENNLNCANIKLVNVE